MFSLAKDNSIRFDSFFTAIKIKDATFCDMMMLRDSCVRSDVPEERIASIIRVKNFEFLGSQRGCTSRREGKEPLATVSPLSCLCYRRVIVDKPLLGLI
jgi:hypothetical protein